ncbi:MAG: bifunctional 4'-phosphopantothenoylcysteine decarboxylase/phosphopantothenoylcysteine synthetase, partial [Candidatus Omnitrophica bacterium]|nr:bifunctional 4'-phosphopantothenoylcysteine decarboxylase/phosphopantothenoylcysteine synthetase [Candidatus Omnitrophota bacterium]
IMTKEAQELIRPLTFQSISENPVYTEMFLQGKDFNYAHIRLAEKGALILVCPATANIIGKIAQGICDDLLTCTIFSTQAPVIFCPAMNENMYQNKIVQENIQKLKKLGYEFVGPVKGRLGCGKIGLGHLAPLPQIVQAVVSKLK